MRIINRLSRVVKQGASAAAAEEIRSKRCLAWKTGLEFKLGCFPSSKAFFTEFLPPPSVGTCWNVFRKRKAYIAFNLNFLGQAQDHGVNRTSYRNTALLLIKKSYNRNSAVRFGAENIGSIKAAFGFKLLFSLF